MCQINRACHVLSFRARTFSATTQLERPASHAALRTPAMSAPASRTNERSSRVNFPARATVSPTRCAGHPGLETICSHELAEPRPLLERRIEQDARCVRARCHIDEGSGIDRCRSAGVRIGDGDDSTRKFGCARSSTAAAMSRSTRSRSVTPANPIFTKPTPIRPYSNASRSIAASLLASPSAAVTICRPPTAAWICRAFRARRRRARRSTDPSRR